MLPSTAQSKPQGGEVVAVGDGKTVGKSKVDISVKVSDATSLWNPLSLGLSFILNLCDVFLFTGRCTSCVLKVCRD